MIRIVVLVLVAANLLYFGWAHWVDRSDPGLTAVTSAPRQPQSVAPPPPPPTPAPCATIGPFGTELETLAAEQKLTAAGWGLARREVTEQQREGYWVYVDTPDAITQVRTLNAIRDSGIKDAFAMPDDPQFRVSVGVFQDENRAQDRASRVQKLKLDAVVKERMHDQQVIWIDVPGVARETLSDGRLAATGLPLDRLRVEACPAGSPKPAADAGAGEAAGAAAGAPTPATPAR
jgi:hypothetical protein